MKKLLAFVAIGSGFAAVEEFLTVVLIWHDLASYLFSVLILFPVFLIFVYISSRLLDRFIPTAPAQDLAHFVLYGMAGLLIEWFLIGLSPWSNPKANPILMLVFQLGMFSFWATVAFTPRLLLHSVEEGPKTGKAVLRFYLPYFLALWGLGALLPQPKRFGILLPLVLFGCLFLNLFYLRYFRRAFSHHT